MARYTIGTQGYTNAAMAPTHAKALKAYLNDVGVTTWSDGADMIVLGPQISLDVPLNFAGRGGIPGVRHVSLADLRTHNQLKGVPSVE